MTTEVPVLGEGIYTFSEARAILAHRPSHLSERQLRYWMDTGLTPPSYRDDRGDAVLSFLDLISLEVVGRFRSIGTSLQRVRVIEETLREFAPDLERPFAYRLFYRDGATIWAKRSNEDDPLVIELLGRRSDRRHKQLAWQDAIATFAEEIRFEGPDERAAGWELSPWVEIDPTVQFGTPIVRGTRIPVRTIAANLAAHSTHEIADWYGLSEQQVEGVRDYIAVH